MTSSPAGFEAFVRDNGEPTARDERPVRDGPPDLVASAAVHGIEILGPPGMLPPAAELPARAA